MPMPTSLNCMIISTMTFEINVLIPILLVGFGTTGAKGALEHIGPSPAYFISDIRDIRSKTSATCAQYEMTDVLTNSQLTEVLDLCNKHVNPNFTGTYWWVEPGDVVDDNQAVYTALEARQTCDLSLKTLLGTLQHKAICFNPSSVVTASTGPPLTLLLAPEETPDAEVSATTLVKIPVVTILLNVNLVLRNHLFNTLKPQMS